MINRRNLQVLMTEIYKIVNSVAPPIMNSLLEFRNNKYNIPKFQVLSTDIKRLVNYGIEKVTYRAPSLGQNYHLNINVQLPLRNLQRKSRNGNVAHVPAN